MLARFIYFTLLVLVIGPAIFASLAPVVFEYVLTGRVTEANNDAFYTEDGDPVTYQHFFWLTIGGIRITYHPVINWVIAISGTIFLASAGWMIFTSSNDLQLLNSLANEPQMSPEQ